MRAIDKNFFFDFHSNVPVALRINCQLFELHCSSRRLLRLMSSLVLSDHHQRAKPLTDISQTPLLPPRLVNHHDHSWIPCIKTTCPTVAN